jgi:hypothetical protein
MKNSPINRILYVGFLLFGLVFIEIFEWARG